MGKIKDIYEGELISLWDDMDYVTISIGLSSIAIPSENWKDLKKEFLKIGKLK